jgi:hypothetical protein
MKRFLIISGLLVTLLALPGVAQRAMRGGGMGMSGGMRGGAMGTGGMQRGAGAPSVNGSMRGSRGSRDAEMQRDRDRERQGMQSGRSGDATRGRQHKDKRARGSQRDAATPRRE